MKISADARNAKARQLVLNWVDEARATEITPVEQSEYLSELASLENLIPIKAMGFRGVVLTSIVAKELDPSFDPLTDFYSCHPRSIFEQGIYYALQESGIPCGKSDPLNVAKNIQKLDYDWAQGRRPQTAARAAVDYLRHLEGAEGDVARRKTLIRLFFRKLLDFADHVATHNSHFVANDQEPPLATARKLAQFATACPEGGTIPQFLVGSLIDALRKTDARFKGVYGVTDSVFGTNTTSKKPADVWEVMADERIGGVYEVTVKKIDKKRLDDCAENLKALGLADKAVTFICRMPDDIQSLPTEGDALIHAGIRFQFISIEAFIVISFCNLLAYDQHLFMQQLEAFVGDLNRRLTTKEYWRQHFGA